jgi:hypothetical protein
MTVDAGPSENTDASLVAQDCTLEQCCSEALAAALGSKSEDNKGGKEAKAAGKGCGCDESPLQLLRTLGCTALVPVGALL